MEVLKVKTSYYKDIRIEDFLDLNFYHPFGYLFAVFFSRLNFSPSLVSVISMIIGFLGAFSIYLGYYFLASIMVVFSSVLDSSDGQLARMKNLSTSYGRIVDGVCGYMVFISVYIAIFLKYQAYYGNFFYCIVMFIAGFSNIIQNSIYDFYRTSFLAVKKNDFSFLTATTTKGFFYYIYRIYLYLQNIFVAKHIKILDTIKNSRDYERLKINYEKTFIKSIQKVNLLGDNWKINGILMLAIFKRLDLFFFYVIIFLNIVMFYVLIIQKKAEKEFLIAIKEV